MSSEIAYLALQLQGPLQAWGFSSQYNRRNTGLMPTKSGILGMCLAALGVDRGSMEEKIWLEKCAKLRLLIVGVPRTTKKYGDKLDELSVRRITDYHTVGGSYDRNNPLERPHIPLTADGTLKSEDKQTVVTHRQYLCDASFVCLLSGSAELISELGKALDNPVWGIWLGRKACIPTAPVNVGIFVSEQEALDKLLGGRSLTEFTRQQDVECFEHGTDSLPDQPLCFAAPDGIRRFTPRRVDLKEAGQ